MSDINARAADAEQLKGNALLQEILKQVEDEAVKAWLASPVKDTEAREFSWMLAKATQRLRDVIQGAIDDRTIAASRAAAPLR